MSSVQHNAALNDLLIQLSRGFLQYVGECSPWTAEPTGATQQLINELVARQRDDIEALSESLDQRGWMIESGTYPTSFTDQHFLALDYLLPQIIASEQELLAASERDVNRLSDDTEVLPLLQQIHEHQADSIKQLQGLSTSRQAHAPAAV